MSPVHLYVPRIKYGANQFDIDFPRLIQMFLQTLQVNVGVHLSSLVFLPQRIQTAKYGLTYTLIRI